MTHSSTRATGVESNERLEFLGDSVLAIVIAQRIFEQYPGHTEGEMREFMALQLVT